MNVVRFFRVVFPALPVIPIIFAEELCLVTFANLFKEEKVLSTFTSFKSDTPFILWLTTDLIAPLSKAFLT